jgi:DNA (cytosine-5)-methyltransferase 1
MTDFSTDIKLLDLFCGAGGCAVGYFRAAQKLNLHIEITGVDINPQPHYPYNFIQADALDFLLSNFQEYSHFHASPPCQLFSIATPKKRKQEVHRDFLSHARAFFYLHELNATIENVPGSPLIKDLQLRGSQFGLKVNRLRIFEFINWWSMVSSRDKRVRQVSENLFTVAGHNIGTTSQWRDAMGIDWMNKKELAQAIPPAYTEYIGMLWFNQLKK